jgi:hypothetical protein
VTRDHDVRQLTTAELELTMRELRANLSLISPDSRRTSRSWLTCGQSTPSWPDVLVTSSPAQETAGYFLARLPQPFRATLIEIRRPREYRAYGR